MTEKVTLLGVLPDGSSRVIGEVPIQPAMKRRDIVRNYIGEPKDDPDACDEASTCLWALNDYHDWLVSQGWAPPAIEITPKA